MFWTKLNKLCLQQNTTPTGLCKKIGIAAGSVTQWKSGSVPRQTTLLKIAQYFNVSVDDLLQDNDTEALTQNMSNVDSFVDRSKIYMIPLYENASAGFGALAVDNIADYIPLVFESKHEANNTICVKVQGDSMFPKIENGDIVQVVKQDFAESGQIVVALINNEEAVVKKIIIGNSWLELHSINPMYMPLRFNEKELHRIQVLGVVKKIIKSV